MPLLEVYGYVGSVLIALSLMMSNIVRLRWINLIGAAVFSTYGVIIQAWPVAFLNGFIVLIDVYHLMQIYRLPKNTHKTRLAADNPYVTDILSIKWPQLSDVKKSSILEVTFLDSEPKEFEILT
jgi:hypothetical protein